MKRVNKFIKIFVFILIIAGTSIVVLKKDTSALSQSLMEKRYIASYDAGWCYSGLGSHMDKMETSYYIYSESDRAKYKYYFEKGIEQWKGNVVIDYTSKGVGYVTGGYSDEEYVGKARVTGNSAGITTQWSIVINDKYFSSMHEFYKYNTMAHEIGHVYGLGDLYRDQDWTNVMYYSSNPVKSVSSEDIIGMKVMNGQHRHSTNCPRRYEMIDTNIHKATCTECNSYIIEDHTDYTFCDKCSY